MTLALIGDFHPQRLGSSWERGLQANGVVVARFDVREAQRYLHPIVRNRITHRLSLRSYSIRHWASRQYNEQIFAFAESVSASIVVFHNGDLVFPETVERLRGEKIRTALFHADNPLPPHATSRPEALPVARAVDSYFVWSERLAGKLRRMGIAGARFLPFAWDEAVFPYSPPPAKPWPGVLFVGGWDRQREEFLDQIAAHFPLKIYGPDYWGSRTRSSSRARASWMGCELRGTDAAKAISDSAISLNILRTQHIIDGNPDGVIMRHFEVPGAGGFLLSTRSGCADRLFAENETAAYFSGIQECLAQIKLYLNNPTLRESIARRAHDVVASHHKYSDLLAGLVSEIEASAQIRGGSR